MAKEIYLTSLESLESVLAAMPDGTTSDILASDLEAGNFDRAHLELPPTNFSLDIEYSGPVAEGYVSPFETGEEE